MKLTRGVQVFDFVKVERTKIKMGNMNVIKVEYRDRNEIKIANSILLANLDKRKIEINNYTTNK